MDLAVVRADLSPPLEATRFHFWPAALVACSWLGARTPLSLPLFAVSDLENGVDKVRLCDLRRALGLLMVSYTEGCSAPGITLGLARAHKAQDEGETLRTTPNVFLDAKERATAWLIGFASL